MILIKLLLGTICSSFFHTIYKFGDKKHKLRQKAREDCINDCIIYARKHRQFRMIMMTKLRKIPQEKKSEHLTMLDK